MNEQRKNEVITLLLAGGKSSRMGQDKALLPFEGIPLLSKMALLARECTSQVAVLTPHPEAYRSILPSDCIFLVEAHPHRGPLLAFAQALPQIKQPWVFLLAVDLPLLTLETVQTWLGYLESLPPESLALVPFTHNYWHPLCGFYHQDCLPSLEAFIASGGTSFQKWLKPSWVQPLNVANLKVLTNCNTPADWQALSS